MSSTVAHRVMDHGEQQRVHPFFGNFTKTSQAPDPALPISSHETRATGHCQAPPSQSSGSDSQQSQIGLDSLESILEEDPNNDRRKRLKTSTHVTSCDVETEERTPTRADDASSTSTITANRNVDSKEQVSPPRKILKLNTNGKLLSSPLAPSLESSVNKRPPSRRRPQVKGKNSKKVAIKYQKGSNIGKKIDNIISGRERHGASQRPAVQLSVSVKNENKPPKPTHPFFLLKKPASKVSAETTPTVTNTVNQHDSTKADAEIPSSTKSSFSRSLFAKIPDMVPPIWPPKDLVHMRGSFLEHSRTSKDINLTQKKSKQRAVHIDEAENILTCESQRIRKEMHSGMSPLRIPTRSVVSGQTLQKAMNSQLSHRAESNFQHGSGYQGEAGRAHPCIAKVYTSIGTSVTSFDSGGRDSVQWTQKYGPLCAEDVLQPGPEARMLRDWLKSLMVSSVDSGNKPTNKSKKKLSGGRKSKRRKTADKLDGFIVSSEDEASEMDELVDSDEDELAGGDTVSSKRTVVRVGDSVGKFKQGETGRTTNAVLISGPSGCGKSASVYAVAKELDFEVFEINSGTRRSAKDILERVGDMTQNHLVQLEGKEDGSGNDIRPVDTGALDGRQNKVNMFFKTTAQKKSKCAQKKAGENTSQDSSNLSFRPHKQSLILLEEVDVLFDEDRQFWIGVLALIEQSKRPVIMTCNNEDLVPLQDLSLYAIFRYHAPPPPLAIDYLLVIAANEGHMLKHEAVRDLYLASNRDLRKSIMELDFWCQMAVGSEKSGIDWILDRWPEGSDLDTNGNRLKVISLHTYHQCMGWFNRDVVVIDNGLAKESELLLQGRNWWELNFETDGKDTWSLDYSEPTTQDQSRSHLDKMQHALDDLDSTIPNISEKEKSNYQEGYPLLIANRRPEYTGIAADIGSTSNVLMRHMAMGVQSLHDDILTTNRVLASQYATKTAQFSYMDYLEAFDPIMQANCLASQPNGRIALSFENGMAEDLAPYIRSIVAFDLRLKRYRDALSGLTTQGSTRRKTRTTRASRAALEGGNKSNTRRERWFTSDINPKRILATCPKSWEDALAREGHLTLPSAVSDSQAASQSDSESSQSTDAEAEDGQI
ncbi:hypothetical protein UA08_06620 [Talaromyces atroroseus]|uniref:AAA+ ATPase domain-containing protein n=1 Tax=Talaromyces atroroseus TaxID=1441469 RepID=A0A225AAZ4_TALAT|nr:hypothetical protein UA08_06620 [Talaromyces atroroseus]OKL58082.1 hypothetical protein UA08_06620 [Talaromyces atroroseus]